MCLERILPYGGVITATDSNAGWRFDTVGQDIKTEDIVDYENQCFHSKNGSASVQYRLIQDMLTDTGQTLKFEQHEQGLSTFVTA